MKKITVLLFLIATGGCKDSRRLKDFNFAYYDLIQLRMQSAWNKEQEFFDAFKQDMDSIKANKNAVIDVFYYQILIARAELFNQKVINVIKDIDEPEKNIKIKEKALRYTILLDSLYKDEYIKCESILSESSQDRYVRSMQVLNSRQDKLDMYKQQYLDARKTIIEIYGL